MDGRGKKILSWKIARVFESCWDVCLNKSSMKSILRVMDIRHWALCAKDRLTPSLRTGHAQVEWIRVPCLCRIFWPKVPVIVLSAHAVPSPGEFPRGAFAWLNKPYESEELLEILGTAVHQAVRKHREQFITAIS